ncbi:MAG: hypothetical protein U0Y10_24195 [Spirosomataceae bacterium]
MKQTIYILTLIFFLSSCGNSQTTNSQKKLTGNIQSDLKMLLPNSNVKADIMDGVLQNPRQAELTKKFQAAIKENYGWFLEYMKTVPEGEPMPYNSKLGLTKEEYTELMGFMDNVEVVSTGKEDIKIEIKNDFISFKSHNKLADLDSLTIDLKNNIVTFRQYKMLFADTLNITTEKNGLKSKWKGYSWKFEVPNNLDIADLKDLSTLNMIQYKFTIGRLEKNGKTYMSLKGREVEDGAKTVDFELPVQF